MKRILTIVLFAGLVVSTALPAGAQTLAVDDPVLKAIWTEALENSQLEPLAHQLLDVNGPRLTSSPQDTKAHQWAVATFGSWGVEAKMEQWGTWLGWRRGICHIDMLEPWVKTLDGNLMSWSPGTRGPVTGDLVVIPEVADEASFTRWLGTVRGKFVAISFPEPTGRPDAVWEANAPEAVYEKMREERNAAREAFNANLQRAGYGGRGGAGRLAEALAEAQVAGILTMSWPNLWMVRRTFGASTDQVPSLVLSLEDYTLLYRLAQGGNTPRMRLEADAEFLGDRPAYNTVAMIPGSEKPDEYVLLMGHLDSWDTSTGACDNGTGSLLAMETLRVLKQVYPNPKRTLVVGLWGSEEQGLNGSAAFVEDHPEIAAGLQAAFNQDNGTGRIVRMSASGFVDAGPYLAKWLSRVPEEVSRYVDLTLPGTPSSGGSDHASFIASGLPAFSLGAHGWEYGYTWHTEIDTYDKIVFDEVRNNVVLAASLAYLACEEDDTLPRTQRLLIDPRTGEVRPWPSPRTPTRKGGRDE
jgi:carboxypeptidase Q